MSESRPILDYQTNAKTANAPLVSVEPLAGFLRIAVARRDRPGGDSLSIRDIPDVGDHPFVAIGCLAVVISWLTFKTVAAPKRRPRSYPRAVFEINRHWFKMSTYDPETAKVKQHAWPRAKVMEVRAGRNGNGVYLDVPGYFKDTVLHEFSGSDLEQIIDALVGAMEQTKA